MTKKTFPLLSALIMLFLSGCAHVATAPTEGKSKTFDEVGYHLQLGGPLFMYVDIDGDIEKAANIIDQLVTETNITEQLNIPKGTFVKIVDLLGLDSVDALGISSIFDGEQRFHNRAFLYTGAERKGIMSFWGNKPHTFEIASMSPADSDIVFEQDVNIKDAFAAIEKAIVSIGGEKAAEEFKDLSEPLKKLAISPRQILEKSDTRVYGIIRVDPKRTIRIPDKDFAFPYTEFLIGVNNMGDMLSVFAQALGELPMFRLEKDDHFDVINTILPLPGDLGAYKPIIARDNSTDRLYIASSRNYMDRCLLNETNVSTNAEYTHAMRGLPMDGNGMSYVSSNFSKTMALYFEELASKNPKMDTVGALLGFILPKGDIGQGSVQKNFPNGILFTGNSESSHKQTLMTIGIANPLTLGVLSAVAIPAFINYTKRAKVDEASEEIDICIDGVRAYVEENGKLPKSSDWTPSEPPSSEAYQLNEALWSISPWKDIGFKPPEEHYFRFSLVAEGNRFVCRAQGDLDDDGSKSLFEMGGTLQNGQVLVDKSITETDPLE